LKIISKTEEGNLPAPDNGTKNKLLNTSPRYKKRKRGNTLKRQLRTKSTEQETGVLWTEGVASKEKTLPRSEEKRLCKTR